MTFLFQHKDKLLTNCYLWFYVKMSQSWQISKDFQLVVNILLLYYNQNSKLCFACLPIFSSNRSSMVLIEHFFVNYLVTF